MITYNHYYYLNYLLVLSLRNASLISKIRRAYKVAGITLNLEYPHLLSVVNKDLNLELLNVGCAVLRVKRKIMFLFFMLSKKKLFGHFAKRKIKKMNTDWK